jgi:mandelate racemase
MRFRLGTSAQALRSAPMLLVDFHTNEQITGRTYLFCFMPMGQGIVARVLDEAATAICGDRVDPERIGAKLARHFRLIGVNGIVALAVSAIDMACWDALAIAAGKPLVEFVGGKRKPVRAYNSSGLGLMPPEELEVEADKLLECGFHAVKLRLGYPTLADNLAAVRAVKNRLPPNFEIMADYNQALTVDEALERGRALEIENLAWIEEPIQHDDYSGCARIARELRTPLQIGENFSGPNAMAAALAAKAADYMMVDLMRIGGVSGWLRAATLAQHLNVPLSSHLLPEFSAAVLGVTPTAHWLEYVDWAAPILAEPWSVANGELIPPDVPGSGIAWDEDTVRHYELK